jgi:replicative DNA helicase
MNIEKIEKQIVTEEKYALYSGEDRVVKVQEVYEDEKNNQRSVFFGTGIGSVDCLIGGFKKGHLIVITGMPKRGKTTFAKTITKNNSDKIKILWFSFEESIYEFYQDIDPCDFYVPKKMKYKDMNWIEARILESKIKYKTEVVFIDHLHYLFNLTSSMQNVTLIIGDLMRTLKRIAVDNELTIFVLAHTKKVEGNRIPRAEDVRDSALIANECDKMFVIHRDRTDGQLGMSSMSLDTKVVIELDRQNGKNMGYVLTLDFENNLLIDKKYEPTSNQSKKEQSRIERAQENKSLW